MDRRKFMESATRWGIIGILVGIISILVHKNAITLSIEKDPKFCDKCSKRSTCHIEPNSSECLPDEGQDLNANKGG
jgi:hypothetical protein